MANLSKERQLEIAYEYVKYVAQRADMEIDVGSRCIMSASLVKVGIPQKEADAFVSDLVCDLVQNCGPNYHFKIVELIS